MISLDDREMLAIMKPRTRKDKQGPNDNMMAYYNTHRCFLPEVADVYAGKLVDLSGRSVFDQILIAAIVASVLQIHLKILN